MGLARTTPPSQQEQRDDFIRRLAPSTQNIINGTREEAIQFLVELSPTERKVLLKILNRRRVLASMRTKQRKSNFEQLKLVYSKPKLDPYAKPR